MPKKILIIDDERDLTALTAKRIRASGYEVECHYEGKNALQVIQDSKADLLLLDLKLPDISGMEIYKDARATPNLQTLPIVFISAMHKEEDYCLNVLGAEGFITKPYDSKVLINTLKRILGE